MTSSPRYPQSNGEAERAVRTMNKLLNRKDDLHVALIVYKSKPRFRVGSNRNGHDPTIAHSTTHPPKHFEIGGSDGESLERKEGLQCTSYQRYNLEIQFESETKTVKVK